MTIFRQLIRIVNIFIPSLNVVSLENNIEIRSINTFANLELTL